MNSDKRRYINTTIWVRTWFRELSHEAKYVYLYLLTSPFSNPAGVYEESDSLISFNTNLDAPKALRELEEKGEIVRFNDWVGIVRHPEFQKWDKGKIGASIFQTVYQVPLPVIELLRKAEYKYTPLTSFEEWRNEYLRLTKPNKDGKRVMAADEKYLKNPPFGKGEYQCTTDTLSIPY